MVANNLIHRTTQNMHYSHLNINEGLLLKYLPEEIYFILKNWQKKHPN